jgi:hypothetical protein
MDAIANPAAVVSGIVSPADRGVLALVRWPSGGNAASLVPAASVADIKDRCLAAILLGKGITGYAGCDGFPGEWFSEGTRGKSATGVLDNRTNPAAPYTVTIDLTGLPGGPATATVFTAVAGAPTNPQEFTVAGGAVATMNNLALAINTVCPAFVLAVPGGFGDIIINILAFGSVGNTVVLSTSCAPADFSAFGCFGGVDGVADPYLFPGRASGQYNLDEIHKGVSIAGGMPPLINPKAGQVRLLTDPAAVTFSPGTAIGGMPILGATTSAIGSTTTVPWLPYSIGGGTDGNFFAYRLPYLADYDPTTGLHYTPTVERSRFITAIAPSSIAGLTKAGNYDDFTTDFWAFQIARYRHRFELQAPPVGAVSRVDNNYAIVHFKKEAYFEEYVRDGFPPSDEKLYSVNMISWLGNVSPYFQLQNVVISGSGVSTSYAMNRTEIVEDANGTAAPVLVAPSYTLTTVVIPTTMFCSGIAYYVPIDVTTATDPNLAITTLAFGFTGMWDRGFRSHDKIPFAGPLAMDMRAYSLNQNTAFVSLSSFSYEGDEGLGTSTIASASPALTLFPGGLGEFRRQRMEFGYADLTPANTADPNLADPAAYSFTVAPPPLSDGIHFTGDTTTPVFTQDAKVRVFVRRPLVVDANGYTEPNPALGFTVPRAGLLTTLYHSMREGNAAVTVPYGNPTNPLTRGVSTTKDKDERFLDEIYRYPASWTPAGPPDTTQLVGPGLPFGPVPIPVPVRPDIAGVYLGWYFMGYHTTALNDILPDFSDALQVAGLPARDPFYVEGVTAPFPSRGLLCYPQVDYSGCDPATAAGNYTMLAGDRCYVRVFDGGATNAGTSTVVFRLWGVALSDFAYTAPTAPGAVGMAFMVKIPGVTAWMDAGRADGSGPSKQDIALDGAGCLVSAVEGTDAASQIHYTDITLNVGPASLFLNVEIPARCPVIVKVIIKDNATGKALNFVGGGETAATPTLRGLVGITLV